MKAVELHQAGMHPPGRSSQSTAVLVCLFTDPHVLAILEMPLQCREVCATALGIPRQPRLQPYEHQRDSWQDLQDPHHQRWLPALSDSLL